MEANEIKAELRAAIEGEEDRASALGADIFTHAELGFREDRTSTLVGDELADLGLEVSRGLAVTGARAQLEGAADGPTVAVIGELDGLRVPDHPDADPETGAAHACGHNAQLAHLVAVARALVATDAQRWMNGNVAFMAVPSEEYADIEWGLEQRRLGRIEFLGGKPELIRLGHFDDVDMAVMVHAVGRADTTPFSVSWKYTGFVAKQVVFKGRATHAAASPHLGINALNAASIGLTALHAQRETFRDEDHVRVHPVMSGTSSAVNVVPERAEINSFVRAATLLGIESASESFDRAMASGALAVGGGIEIKTMPGYLPLDVDRDLGAVFRNNAIDLVGEENWSENEVVGASTDAGDLSQLMPVLHPSHGGCTGNNHAADFRITDPHAAYIAPATALAWTIVDLLVSDKGRRIADSHRPLMSKTEYLDTIARLEKDEVRDFSAGY